MREYKVSTLKARSIGMPMSETDLQNELNAKAAEGWLFDKAIGGESRVLKSEVHFLIFYRDRP